MLGAGRTVPGRWTAAAYTFLMVALTVAESAVVTLTVHDPVQLVPATVQLGRVTGPDAERPGDLLPPGTPPHHLAAGTYVFRTSADAQVQLGEGSRVHVLAVAQANDKDGDWPDPQKALTLPTAKG